MGITDKSHNIEIGRLEPLVYHPTPLSGLSKPALITAYGHSGERTVIAKFKSSVRNRELSLAAELLCSCLAADLGIPVPTPFLINIPREFSVTVKGFHGDLMLRSEGWNFGSEYMFPGYSVVQPYTVLGQELMGAAAEILAFDVMIQNYDRQLSNPNLLTNGEQLCVIDHESAFSPVLATPAFNVESLNLDHYYQHILFHSINKNAVDYHRFEKAVGNIQARRVKAYFETLPEDWLGEVDQIKKLTDYLLWCIEERKTILNAVRELLA